MGGTRSPSRKKRFTILAKYLLLRGSVILKLPPCNQMLVAGRGGLECHFLIGVLQYTGKPEPGGWVGGSPPTISLKYDIKVVPSKIIVANYVRSPPLL